MANPVLLAPHETPELYAPGLKTSVPWDESYIVSSTKINGDRCICVRGSLYTRAMRQANNMDLPIWAEPLCQMAADEDLVIDMELCDREAPHHALFSGVLNALWAPISETTKAYIFDAMPFSDWQEQCVSFPYRDRILLYREAVEKLADPKFVALDQRPCASAEDALEYFNDDMAGGDEGSMLRTTDILPQGRGRTIRGGWYKHGRATPLQQIIWKMKNNVSADGQILEVIPRRKLKDGWPREYDVQGRLKKVQSVEAFETEDCVGSFLIAVSLDQLGVQVRNSHLLHTTVETVFGSGFTMDLRRRIWDEWNESPEKIRGRWVELQHTPHGGKDIVRGGKLKGAKILRFRGDKDVDQGTVLMTKEYLP